MRKHAPLAVELPPKERDNPGWLKVGAIAAVGFVIGVAWPRVMGVRLGPSAPGEAAAAASAAASAAQVAAAETPPAAVAKKAATAPVVARANAKAAAETPAPAASGPPQIRVQRGAVLSCKTKEGATKTGKDCGRGPAIDALITPRLRKLESCAAAVGQTGKLSIVVTAEFPSGKLTHEIGKSTTVGRLDAINACLRAQLDGLGARGVAHDHPHYVVAYKATFAPPAGSASPAMERVAATDTQAPEPAQAPEREASPEPRPSVALARPSAGEASVEWDVGLVRDLPKTGQVVGRLQRGTKVKLGPAKDGWYSVKFGDSYAKEGWIYRGAIGR
jgi:hypothetical protein